MPSSRRSPAADRDASAAGKRTLKKYPNRRLYDTQSSSYITLADVKRMVLAREDFDVRDAKTGEDITRSILLQIILEEESGGVPIFSTQTLEQIIRFYGHASQGLMGAFMENNMRAFGELQARLAESGRSFTPEIWTQFLGPQSPFVQGLMTPYLEQSKAMFDRLQEQLGKGSLFPGMPGSSSDK
ncbi:MAG: polyhydroxyalkanoate synthesis repressor PhaR [Proteobacteria bacterium]|nr:polyhydroxyalkanoate synthesis repressor PhaR [Pseudomonadota bacterium]